MWNHLEYSHLPFLVLVFCHNFPLWCPCEACTGHEEDPEQERRVSNSSKNLYGAAGTSGSGWGSWWAHPGEKGPTERSLEWWRRGDKGTALAFPPIPEPPMPLPDPRHHPHYNCGLLGSEWQEPLILSFPGWERHRSRLVNFCRLSEPQQLISH